MDTFNISSLIEDSLDTDSEVMFRKPSAAETIKHKKITADNMRTYMQGTLPTSVAANSEELSNLKDGSTPFEAISLSTGRTAFQELTSGTLSASGWYTIAEVEAGGNIPYMAEINCGLLGAYREEVAGCVVGGTTHPFSTTQYIKLKDASSWDSSSIGIKSFRLATSTISSSGAKVQVYLEVYPSSNMILNTQITQNLSNSATKKGVELALPYLDNTPILPDGVTAETFFVAGEELSFDANATILTGILQCSKASSDVLNVTAVWPELPYQGSTVAVTFPSSGLVVRDSSATVTLTSATYSSPTFVGKNLVNFNLTSVGSFASLGAGPLKVIALGSGGKITLLL